MKSKSFGCLLIALALLMVLIQFLWLGDRVYFNVYFARDFERAEILKLGYLVFVGSDTISDGYTLGPFFYFLAYPFTLFSNSAALMIYSFFFVRLLGSLYLARILNSLYSIPVVASFILIQASNSMANLFSWFNNAAVAFSLMMFCMGHIFYNWKSKTKITSTHAFCFSLFLGFCLQLHYSYLYVIVAYFFVIINQGLPKRVMLLSLLGIALPQSFFVYSMVVSFLDDPRGLMGLGEELVAHFDFLKRQSLKNIIKPPKTAHIKTYPFRAIEHIALLGLVVFSFIKRLRSKNDRPDIEILFFVSIALYFSSFVNGTQLVRYFSYALIVGYLVGVPIIYRAFKPILFSVLVIFVAFANIWIVTTIRSGGLAKITMNEMLDICEFMGERNVNYDEFRSNAIRVMPKGYYTNRYEGLEYNYNLASLCMEKGERKTPTKEYSKYLFMPYGSDLTNEDLKVIEELLPKDFFFNAILVGVEKIHEGADVLYELKLKEKDLPVRVSTTNLSYAYEIDAGTKFHSNFPDYWNTETANIASVSVCKLPFFCEVYVKRAYDPEGTLITIESRMFKTMEGPHRSAAEIKNVKFKYQCNSSEVVNSIKLDSHFGKIDRTVDPDKTFLTTPLYISIPNCKSLDMLTIDADYIADYGGNNKKRTTGNVTSRLF